MYQWNRVEDHVSTLMNRNFEIWCAWPKCESNLWWICIKWTNHWCLLILNTSMTGQTWCIKLQIYWVCVKRSSLPMSVFEMVVVYVALFFYVIIYIFSRCVCAHTIIDRSACTEEREREYLLLSMPVCRLSSSSHSSLSSSQSKWSCTTNTKAHRRAQSQNALTPGQSIDCIPGKPKRKQNDTQRGMDMYDIERGKKIKHGYDQNVKQIWRSTNEMRAEKWKETKWKHQHTLRSELG